MKRIAPQIHGRVLAGLALVALAGWASAQGPDGAGGQLAPIKLTVHVPDKDASLMVDGYLTKTKGTTVRYFQSDPFPVTKKGTYILKVTWTEKGEDKTLTQKVRVRGGDEKVVKFTQDNTGKDLDETEKDKKDKKGKKGKGKGKETDEDEKDKKAKGKEADEDEKDKKAKGKPPVKGSKDGETSAPDMTEWAAAAPNRLLPMATLPFWDLEESMAELTRAANMGHRGVIMSQDPSYFGAPHLDDRQWDPLWALAQEAKMPINFHIASGDMTGLLAFGGPEMEDEARYAASTVLFSWGNAKAIATLIAGGVCERFPDLNFVSVESGIGWMPYLVAYLDWQFANSNSKVLKMTPTEYFKRQIYGCFWFEDKTAKLTIDALGPDNFLYESDFPHPTSMTPGPATVAVAPRRYIADTFGDLPEDVLSKILHDNAARIYNLDPLP